MKFHFDILIHHGGIRILLEEPRITFLFQDMKTEPKVPTPRTEPIVPTPLPPDLELDLPHHLPDYLAEQFCQLSTADTTTKSTVDNFKECQLNIVLKTRHNEDSSEDWGRMIDLISGRLTGLLPPLNSPDKIQGRMKIRIRFFKESKRKISDQNMVG